MRGFSLLAAASCAACMVLPVRAEETVPITVDVLFQSCTDDGYATSCMFYGQGKAFDTNDGFGTEPELMRKLIDLPVNTPLRISGELFGPDDGEPLSYLRLTGFEPGPEDPHAELRGLLQGGWLWPDGPDYGLRVTGSEWVSLLAGQETNMRMLHIVDACPDTAASAGAVILRGYGGWDDESLCLRIDEIDADRMLVYEPKPDVYTEWRRP